MKTEIAYKVLELDINDKNISINQIKRQYHIKALIYHPDKNKDTDAVSKFQEINTAYEHILKTKEFINNNDENSSYKNILLLFLNKILENETSNSIFYNIINRVTVLCEEKAVELLEKLDKSTLIKTKMIISKYQNELHITKNLINRIDKIIEDKNMKDECIILNPTLHDLYEQNLYKLTHQEKTYIIPLWHHELIYELDNNKDLYINCYPILAENIEIDENNNIHINVVYNVNDIWGKEYIYVTCDAFELPIQVNTLKMIEDQIIIFVKKGITKINTKQVYNISENSDVVIHIKLCI
jgi:hypothetical protein